MISDDAHAGVEFVVSLVDRANFFAWESTADDDLVVFESIEVEGVEWLSAFEHDIVGDVDDVIDGVDADGSESVAEPCGAGADAYAADEAGVVFVAEISAVDADRDGIGGVVSGFGDGRRRDGEYLLEEDGDFAGDADMSEAIRAVAGDFEIDGDIGAGEAFGYVMEFFEVEPGECESVGEFGGGVRQADVVGEPVAAGDHGRVVEFWRKFLRSWMPEAWLFSGWNWTAATLFLATAETKGAW